MGYHIHHGDCLDVMNGLGVRSMEMCIADIPYGVVSRESNGLRNLDKGKADVETFDVPFALHKMDRIVTGSTYIFCATEQVSLVRTVLVGLGYTTRLIIWEKTNPSPLNGDHIWLSGIETCVYGRKHGAKFNLHCQNTVLRYPTVRGKRHPTEKSVPLLKYLIEASSEEGDTVLDFVMGSGSTGEAALLTGRNFVGIELYPLIGTPVSEDNPDYFGIAAKRLQSVYAKSLVHGQS